MESILHEWISLFVRWAHIVAAMGWIGASFYFMWLDASLKKRKGLPKGAKGDSWAVHGGGFYHVVKYQIAPEEMPEALKWFKWESYTTWLTGFLMLMVTYYWGANGFLIDREVMDLEVWEAITISVLSLALAWIFYDMLCKSPLRKKPILVFAVLFVGIVAAAYGFQQVFSARAAWLHTGAIIATMMTGNVFLVIIPNSRVVVADLKAGRTPDGKYGEIAKLRSTHNNYLTLPVVLMMISNHYPITFGHPYAWVMVAMVLVIGAVVRIFYNMHEAGIHGKAIMWQWPVVVALGLGLIAFSTWRPDQVEVDFYPTEAMEIVATHCSACHSSTPTHEFFEDAPGDVRFDSLDEIRAHRSKMLAQAVLSNSMPLGNETGMTPEERAILGSWLRAGAPAE
ncbi:MAG: urate hydroxylase PuuD [Rhodobacteraceae bacterium]|nr:urate hydroxylase PuuD [Paracoccaceae bacterium]